MCDSRVTCAGRAVHSHLALKYKPCERSRLAAVLPERYCLVSWTLIVSVVPPSLLSEVLFQSNPEHIVPSSHSTGDASQ